MKIFKEESGQVLVLTALSMVLLLGFVGFATDVGVLLHERRIVQTAADSAAIAGATEALQEGSPTTVSSGMWNAAASDAKLNGFTPGATNGATSSSGTTLTINTDSTVTLTDYQSAGYVQAIVTHRTPTIFMGAFGAIFGFSNNQGGGNYGTINVSASAIASDNESSNGCMLINNSEQLADPAMTTWGSSNVFASDCGINVNGDLLMGGSSTISSAFVDAQGSITNDGHSSISGSQTPNIGSPAPDPLAAKLQQDNLIQPGTTPGGKCGGTWPANGMDCIYDFNGGKLSGTLQSNTIYYFDNLVNIDKKTGLGDGPYIDQSGGPVTGTNVMIYLADNIPLDFSNNGTFTLTAPTTSSGKGGCADADNTNPYCGILIDAPLDGKDGAGTYTCSNGKGNNQGNRSVLYFDFGSSTTVLKGILYAPYMQMFIQDQGADTTLGINTIVGNFCSQSATLSISGFSGPQSPVTRVGLVY